MTVPIAATIPATLAGAVQRHSNSLVGPLRFSPPMWIGGSGRKRIPLRTASRADPCSSGAPVCCSSAASRGATPNMAGALVRGGQGG